MSTKELEKLVVELSNQVVQLRSFVISVAGKDKEGNYRADFVKEINKARLEKPVHKYSGPGSLLKLLKNN